MMCSADSPGPTYLPFGFELAHNLVVVEGNYTFPTTKLAADDSENTKFHFRPNTNVIRRGV